MRGIQGKVFIAFIGILGCFSALAIAAPTKIISGVVATDAGTGVEGVDVVGDNGATSTVTAADGSYTITIPNNWSGTITATKEGWLIAPASKSYIAQKDDLADENFLAYQPKISGHVTKSDGTPLAGAVVTANNGGGTDTTDASGYYEFYVPYNWSGTVSAVLAGYHFTDKSYTNIIADQINQGFNGYQPTISGSTGIAGAMVTISGVGVVTSTPDYTVTVPYGWSGTITAELAGYNFTNSPISYTNVTTDTANQNFTPYQPTISGSTGVAGAAVTISGVGSVVSTPEYSVTVPYSWSGTVSVTLAGYAFTDKNYTNVVTDQTNQNFSGFQPTISGSTGVAGATVTVSGIGSVVSTPEYSVTVPYGWSGTIEATLAGYHFPESPRSYTTVTTDQMNQDFTGFQPTISGSTGVVGATVTISGVCSIISTPEYSVAVPYDWGGTVEATLAGYDFSDSPKSYTNVTTDQMEQNFTPFQPTISGTVTQEDGTPVASAAITADNGGGSDTTDASGHYEIIVPYNWSGQVRANKLKWDIVPESYSYINLISDQLDQDFTASYISTIIVKADGTGYVPTIQSAIDIAVDGEEIIAYPGRYYENIDFCGKNIILQSTNPEDPNIVATTIIDAGNSGSVITFAGNETLECNLSGFTITGGLSSTDGGGVYGNFTQAKITNCIITDNEALEYGGGALFRFDGEIRSCTITNNRASRYGGGLHQSDADIYDSIISNNYAARGGGFYGCNGGVKNCIMEGNHADKGGVFNNCVNGVRECIISDNYATFGGAFYDCIPAIYDSTIKENSAYFGGGFYDCSGYITRCVIKGNATNFDGGGLYEFNGHIQNCIVRNNIAYGRGGGFYGGNAGYWDAIENCTILDNSAGISNEEGYYGSGLYGYNGPIRNCIVWANNSWKSNYSQYPQIYNCQIPSYSCIEMWTGGGTGNIDDYPYLTGYSENYHLKSYSPCINAGDPNILFKSYELDIDQNYRVVGGRIDMGADEFFIENSSFIHFSENHLEFVSVGVDCEIEPQMIKMLNLGEEDLNYRIENVCDWLQITPVLGSLDFTQLTDFELIVDPTIAGYGTHNCEFTIIDPNASNSPQVVTVTLDVLRPEIEISTGAFSFECDVDEPNVLTTVLPISNSGYDTLNWQITEDCDWLSAEPASGQCTTETDNVRLSVDTAGMEIGFYNCELTIIDDNASNSPRTVPVWLHVYRDGERHVPAEYSIIQQAIDAAADGDHVIIHPGIYHAAEQSGRIDIFGKALTIQNLDPDDVEIVNSTILNGIDFNFSSSEGRDIHFEGFTLNGKIGCSFASPVIRNCRIIAFNYPRTGPGSVQGSVHAISVYGNRTSVQGALIQNCLVNIYGETDYYVSQPILVDDGKAEVINSTIAYSDMTYNSQLKPTGGILVWQSDVSIKNSIIWGNRAISDVQIAIINKSSDSNDPFNSRVHVAHSDIEGGRENILIFPDSYSFDDYVTNGTLPDPNLVDPNTLAWGSGNIDADPLFVRLPDDGGDGWIIDFSNQIDESANNDYGNLHLKSQAGRFVWEGYSDADFNRDKQVDLIDFAIFARAWLPFQIGALIFHPCDLDGDHFVIGVNDLVLFCEDYLQPRVFGAWVTDDVTSPCIDAGDPADMGCQNELWPHGGRVNMGAYGGTAQASMSPNPVGNPADLNHDDAVDMIDWPLWAGHWGDERTLLASDFDRNNIVDANDMTVFMENWLW